MGCRFSDACSPEQLWNILTTKTDCVARVPAGRWSAEDATLGGFLSQPVDLFDRSVFQLSADEANSMDPQQRLLLEVAWEALERAGYCVKTFQGSSVGVYIGMSSNDYQLLYANNLKAAQAPHFTTGTALGCLAGRLSYIMNFQGPSVTIDTSCSSSLVAVDLACKAVRSGECSMALAGGVNLLLSPLPFVAQTSLLSSSGRCKVFDSSADGYVRGEGCGVVVLKRLSAALADRDTVLAVIRGSAVNNDGSRAGLTAPNGLAQQRVLRTALADARVSAEQVSYVEAHGTGVALDDLIELGALVEAFPRSESTSKLLVGSIKTNLGHTEGAAGIAGLIKVVLACQHKYLPAHLHLNSKHDVLMNNSQLDVSTAGMEWLPTSGSIRIAGVSSFGFAGTNAHVIVEEAPGVQHAQQPQNIVAPSVRVLTLSAMSAKSLEANAQAFASYLSANPSLSLADVCYTVNVGRSHMPHRLAINASGTAGEVAANLARFVKEGSSAAAAAGTVSTADIRSRVCTDLQPPQVAFIFTGQGSQYVNMGKDLYEAQPVFKQWMDSCNNILRQYLERPLLSVVYPDTGESETLINETEYTQPALFALEYSLCKLWESWGVTPTAVLGHSVGELAAACVAGVFSLEDGLKLIAHRARLMASVPKEGSMYAVFETEEVVSQAIAPYSSTVSVAGINGPKLIVISGKTSELKKVGALLTQRKIRFSELVVSNAFHSPLMDTILNDIVKVAETIQFHAPKCELISNVTGKPVVDGTITPGYWPTHVRSAVRFSDSMTLLQESMGCNIFIEIGPQPVLLGMAGRILEKTPSLSLIASMQKASSSTKSLAHAIGDLYVAGINVDFEAINNVLQCGRIPLPTYSFERERHWL